jgi:hypothetical protein
MNEYIKQQEQQGNGVFPCVYWHWFAYTHDGDFPFEEHNFTDFNEMKRFSARHSKIYKTETNKYRSGYERINAT